MINKKTLLISIVALFVSNFIYAQSSSSPYSIFGAGLASANTFGANLGLGGTGIANITNTGINNLNPASYTGFDSLSFHLEFGVYSKFVKYETNSNTQSKLDGNLSHFAIGFRYNKWLATSLGIEPYSTIGYNINSSLEIAGINNNTIPVNYYGEGGINRFYWGNSLRLNKNISLGVNLSYFMGSVTQSESTSEINDISPYTLSTTQYFNNLVWDYGIILSGKIKNTDLAFGATYSKGNTLDISSDYLFVSENDTVELKEESAPYQIPQSFGFGLTITRNNRIRFSLDYQRKEWGDIEFSNRHLDTRHNERYALGLELLPETRKNNKGLKSLNYRIGGFYNKSYLVIQNQPINQKAVTFGLGIPVNKKLSNIFMGLELGQYGTKNSGLIKESYVKLNINMGLKDIWFQKARYH